MTPTLFSLDGDIILPTPPTADPMGPDRPVADRISSAVERAMAFATRVGRRPERRTSRRHLFPYAVRMTPVERDGRTPAGPIFSVIGKHIADRGFDFYSHQPVPYRRMIATFTLDDNRSVGLLMDVSWCRFSAHGWYENGGRFLDLVAARGDSSSEVSFDAD